MPATRTEDSWEISSQARAGLGALLAVLVLLTFGRSAGFEFLTWDDGINVYSNPLLNPPTAVHLGEIWKGPIAELYIPVPYTIWWTVAHFAHVDFPDDQGSQLNPWLFHAVNILVHAVTVLVVFGVLRRWLGKPGRDATWAAFAGALVFAIHPLQVETVAWVTGLRDLLGGMFAVIALWQYTLAASGKRSYWVGAVVAFAAAMLSKPSTVVLPVIALAIDLWIVGRPIRRAIVPVAIGLLLTLPVLYVTQRVQARHVATPGPIYNRLFVAGDSMTFYLRQLFYPRRLALTYGRRPEKIIGHPALYAELLAPAVILLAAWLLRRSRPGLWVAAIVFFAALLPVSGIVPFNFQYYSTVADHYAYLAMLGAAMAVGSMMQNPLASRRAVRFGSIIFASIIGVGFIVRDEMQLPHWRDSAAAWEHADAVTPGDFVAETELGLVDVKGWQDLTQAGRVAEAKATERRAIERFRRALANNPMHGVARKYLAVLELDEGDWPRAVADARELASTARAQPISNAVAHHYADIFAIFAAEANHRGDAADARLFRDEFARIAAGQ